MTTFKEFEHNAWQIAVDQYDASFSRLTRQMIPTILETLEIQRGTKFLDVACGPGHLSAAAFQKEALVTGVDFSSSMVSRAKQLHPEIDFHEGDAEDLKNFRDNQFNALGMNFGIIHLGFPEKALKAAHRVLQSQGKVAFTAWCKPQEAIGFSLILQAVEKCGNPHVALPEAPPLFFYSDHDNCKNSLRACGFINPQIHTVNQIWQLHSEDELFEAFLKGTARTAGLLKGQSKEQLDAIKESLRRLLSSYRHEGKIALPMPAHVATATKP